MKMSIDKMMKILMTPQSIIKLISSMLLNIFRLSRVEVAIKSMAIVAAMTLMIE
jgi:hypothetical protein